MVHDVVLAAIAYGDALTIKSAGIQNTRDHSALPETLSAALGNRFPFQMQKHLADLLAQKDDSAYGRRTTTKSAAERAVQKLNRFAEWAERELL